MAKYDWGAVARILALTLVAIAFWWLAKYGYAKPRVLSADAPATVFSAGRAEATLARVLGPEKPHPVSSDENAAVRARILTEFASLGVKTSTYTAFTCNAWRGFRAVPCATVTDILAEIVPGVGKAIVLLAHYDSVPAGPGASDDESGVSIVLETVRALQARGEKSRHPILAVITDGEEAGLLGAQAFLENPRLKARVGAVVNVEARGTRGRSLLFQTSPGDSKLIDLYAKSLPYYATSSLYAEIYRFLPNDTDLTLFIKQGFTSFNFAFSENVADYHTPLDRRANLSPLTLQEQGENLLGIVTSLEQTDYAGLKGGDDVYLDVFGAFLPRIHKPWVFPLAILAFLLLIGAAIRARAFEASRGRWIAALLLPPALIVASVVTGFVLHFIAQAISGQPDPSYAYPIALREGLGFGVLAAALLTARMASARLALFSIWLWFGLLSVVMAAFLPGISSYFLFPALLAAVAALAFIAMPSAMEGFAGELAFVPAAVLGLSIWISLVATGETLMGLKLHELFTVPAAFAAMMLMPFVSAQSMPRSTWRDWYGAAIAGSLIAAVIAGFQPAYSRTQAQRLNIRYVEDATTGRARWALDADAPLPPPLRAATDFSKMPQQVLKGPFPSYYTAPAGNAQFPAPQTKIVSDAVVDGERRITMALSGSPQADAMFVVIPKEMKLVSIDIHGEHLVAPKDNDTDTILACVSRDCASEVVTFEFASRAAFKLSFGEQRYGAPASAAKLVAARPKSAIPSQTGDIVVLTNSISLDAK